MTGSPEPVLQLAGVAIQYGPVPVVSGATFDVRRGEFVTLLGPSGSGKTSLLRAIAGFVRPASGEIRLHGARINDVPPYQRDIGLVFQNYALFPHMTVGENLSFGLNIMRMDKAAIALRVGESLEHVRLSGLEDRYPHQLSGGQQQRVAIARALAIQPSILLLDEPMSNLDARLRAEMRDDLTALLKRLGATAVSVTHNQEEALAMSDRIIVMSDGRIRQIGTPMEIYSRPADPFVADFVGDANVFPGRHADAESGLVRYETDWGQSIYAPAGGDRADSALLLIRPEAIEITRQAVGATRNCAIGRLTRRAYMGAFVEFRVAVGEREFLVKKAAAPIYADFAIGDEVFMCWEPAAVVALQAP